MYTDLQVKRTPERSKKHLTHVRVVLFTEKLKKLKTVAAVDLLIRNLLCKAMAAILFFWNAYTVFNTDHVPDFLEPSRLIYPFSLRKVNIFRIYPLLTPHSDTRVFIVASGCSFR